MNRAMRYACLSLIVLILTLLLGCGFNSNQTLQTLTVSSTSASMVRGTTQQLVATGQFSDGTSKQLGAEVLWTSSNTAIATVSTSGVVTGVAIGVATISAASGTASASTTISVEIHLTSISITGTTTAQSGGSQQLTAVGKYDDGSTATITAAWTSSDTTVATVAGGGVVTAVSMGTSTITAASGSIKGTVAFSVTGIASGTVDNTGGTIQAGPTSPMPGVKVEIPAGALDPGTTVKINVNYETTPPGPLPAGVTQSSNVLVLTKDMTTDFKLPLTVTIPVDPAVLAAGDLPVVFYWNDTYAAYEAASLVDVDTTANTVTFETVHFSKYVALNRKGGWAVNNQQSVDTGFRPTADGFFHPNFGSYITPGGSSLGMSLYASWYYGAKKAKDGHGLYSKYLEGDISRWQDDATARELISRAYAASSLIWAKLALNQQSKLSANNTAQAILTAMSTTSVPQVVILRGKTWAQAVLIFGWDSGTQRFQVYDPNFPGEVATLGWSSSGPSAYSKAAAYSDPIQNAEFHGMSIALASTEFEQLYAGAETGFSNSLFNQITVNTPTLDANNAVVVQDGTGLTVQGSLSGGSKTATAIVYCINGDCSGKPASVSGNAFNFPLPTLTGSANSIMLIATTDPKNPWTAFAGFKQFTIKVQGNVFFTNPGFEDVDTGKDTTIPVEHWFGWTHETHLWWDTSPNTVHPEKSEIVHASDIDELFNPTNHSSTGTITTIARSGGVVTGTLSGQSTYAAPGSTVVVADVTDASFNGTFTVISASSNWSSTTFTYSQPLADASSSGGTTTFSPKAIYKGYSGSWAARVNNYDDSYHRSTISQTVTVPNVSNPELRFAWAAILEDPNHDPANQPFVDVEVMDVTTNTQLYKKHFFSNDPSYPGWIWLDVWGSWKAIDWQQLTVSLSGVIGDQVRITVLASDCGYGGHGGYVYFDGDVK